MLKRRVLRSVTDTGTATLPSIDARHFRIGELASMRLHDAGDGASPIVRSSAAD